MLGVCIDCSMMEKAAKTKEEWQRCLFMNIFLNCIIVKKRNSFYSGWSEMLMFFSFCPFVEQNSVLPDGVRIGGLLHRCMSKLVGV